MLYQSLSVTGFGPHATTKKYTFNQGTILITGSNGAGKTTIIDAIAWALHGTKSSLRSIKDKTSIINSSSQTAKVSLEVIHDETSMIVTRSMTRSGKHSLAVEVDGKEQEGGINALQEVINDFFFGINANTFTSISTMSSSPSMTVNPFISQSDADRREFLSELVDPEREFEMANKVIKNRIREEKRELNRLEGRLQGLLESAPEEPNSVRLTEVGEEISSLTKERKRLEQKMSAARSRDDVQVSGLISTHRSELEALESRITELKVKREKLVTEMEDNYSDIEDLEDNMTVTYQQMRDAKVSVDSLEHERIGLSDRISYYLKVAKVLGKRRDDVKSKKMALDRIMSLGLDGSGECAVCGAELTEESHAHINSMKHEVDDFSDKLEKLDNDIADAEDMAEVLKDYREEVDYSLTTYDPKKLSADVDRMISRIERISNDQDSVIKGIAVIDKDIFDLEERCTHHEYMVDSLTAEADPEVLKNQDSMNESWDYVADQISELYSEQARLEDLTIAYDKHMDRIDRVEKELNKTMKIVSQLMILKDQTSPTGVISSLIADVAHRISESATMLIESTFGRNAVVDIVTGTDDGDVTCQITVDGRDLSTHSHGEQARFITAILTALAVVSEEVTGCWVPLLWDEPTMATDIGISMEFVDMISAEGNRQVFVVTRDEFPDIVDQIIDLDD